MRSRLVEERLFAAGLTPLLDMRAQGEPPRDPVMLDLVARTDILLLGAAADMVRRRECGDEARIYVPCAPREGPGTVVLGAAESARGTALLRRIATMRLTGDIGLAIVVDWSGVGMEIAQVALSFGASDLAGLMASRRGLPMLESDDQKKLVKRREIAGFVERAGFRPIFVLTDPSSTLPELAGDSSNRGAHVDS
jgi:hypothetical protein